MIGRRMYMIPMDLPKLAREAREQLMGRSQRRCKVRAEEYSESMLLITKQFVTHTRKACPSSQLQSKAARASLETHQLQSILQDPRPINAISYALPTKGCKNSFMQQLIPTLNANQNSLSYHGRTSSRIQPGEPARASKAALAVAAYGAAAAARSEAGAAAEDLYNQATAALTEPARKTRKGTHGGRIRELSQSSSDQAHLGDKIRECCTSYPSSSSCLAPSSRPHLRGCLFLPIFAPQHTARPVLELRCRWRSRKSRAHQSSL